MKKGWTQTTLKNVTSLLGDGLHGTPKYDEKGEYYFINGNNLQNGKIIIKDDTKRISEDEYQKIKKNLNDRTILVAINGTLGNVGVYKGEKIALGKSACYFNINQDVEKQFIKYIIESPLFQMYAPLFATGATIKNLSLKAVRNFSFLLPPFPTQQKIAHILSAYDDLIENNLKRIKLLEEMAQITYEQWFVRLKFPGHETTPIDAETGFPDGWYARNIDEFCSKITDGTHESPKEVENGIPLVTGRHIMNGFIKFDSAYSISMEDHNKIKKRSGLDTGDILFSNIGTLGNIGVVSDDVEFSCKNVIIFKRKQNFDNFLYTYLANKHTKNKLDSQSAGVAQKFYSLKFIRGLSEVFPRDKLLNEFDKKVSPIYKLKYQLNKQNNFLKEARDILLPRLMTGMINVDHIELPVTKQETKAA